jgi:hypothetical protein
MEDDKGSEYDFLNFVMCRKTEDLESVIYLTIS